MSTWVSIFLRAFPLEFLYIIQQPVGSWIFAKYFQNGAYKLGAGKINDCIHNFELIFLKSEH